MKCLVVPAMSPQNLTRAPWFWVRASKLNCSSVLRWNCWRSLSKSRLLRERSHASIGSKASRIRVWIVGRRRWRHSGSWSMMMLMMCQIRMIWPRVTPIRLRSSLNLSFQSAKISNDNLDRRLIFRGKLKIFGCWVRTGLFRFFQITT